MDPTKYQTEAMRTECDQPAAWERIAEGGLYPTQATRMLHSVVGLSSEVGEVASAMQDWLWYGQAMDRVKVVKEMGDICWYLAQLSDAMGCDLGVILQANIDKLKARYPEKWSLAEAQRAARSEEREDQAVTAVLDDPEADFKPV